MFHNFILLMLFKKFNGTPTDFPVQVSQELIRIQISPKFQICNAECRLPCVWPSISFYYYNIDATVSHMLNVTHMYIRIGSWKLMLFISVFGFQSRFCRCVMNMPKHANLYLKVLLWAVLISVKCFFFCMRSVSFKDV